MGRYYDKSGIVLTGGLREARKVDGVPSVTTVLNVLDKSGLTEWKIKQGILAALTLPKIQDETDEDYLKRILLDSKEHSKNAADMGTEIHNFIENYLKKKIKLFQSHQDTDYVWTNITNWIDENIGKIFGVEEVVICPNLAVAGRYDCYCMTMEGQTLIDWKTQAVKKDKPIFYEEWTYQLGGLHLIMNADITQHWSVVISAAKDTLGNIYVKKWSYDEIIKGMQIFNYCLQIFKLQKNL
jgi:hypothetical protein